MKGELLCVPIVIYNVDVTFAKFMKYKNRNYVLRRRKVNFVKTIRLWTWTISNSKSSLTPSLLYIAFKNGTSGSRFAFNIWKSLEVLKPNISARSAWVKYLGHIRQLKRCTFCKTVFSKKNYHRVVARFFTSLLTILHHLVSVRRFCIYFFTP